MIDYKFVLKRTDNEDGSYFGIVTDGDFKGSYRWLKELSDIKDGKILVFDSQKDAEVYIKEKLVPPFYQDEKPEIVKIASVSTVKYYEQADPEIFKRRNELQEKLLNVRGHKDAFMALLTDESLVHDMNACAGYIRRMVEGAGLKCGDETFEYSDLVHNRCYYDNKGKWLPDKMLRNDSLAFKTRRVCGALATLADSLALLDKYAENANASRRK